MAEKETPPKDRSPGVKSAYEAALERMAARGIEGPREASLDPATKEAIAEARRKADAKLAELEILHRDRLKTVRSADERDQEEAGYRRDRERIESDRDREIERLRGDQTGPGRP